MKRIFLVLMVLLTIGSTTAQEPVQNNAIVLLIGVDCDAITQKRTDRFAQETEYLGEAIIKTVSSIYTPVVKSILNTDATRENCLEGFQWVRDNATANDLVVIYVGTHGTSKGKDGFKFYPADKKVITGAEIKQNLAGLSSEVLLIMDACHSGALIGDLAGMDINVITACDDEEVAYTWGLTVALVESIEDGSADSDKDGVITISEVIKCTKDNIKYNRHPMSIGKSKAAFGKAA